MQTVTSSVDLAREVAETERAARDLTEQAAAKRAEHDRVRAAEADAREEATEEFWHGRRQAFGERVRAGGTDVLWQAFAAAVRDGGDAITAWREYRLEVRRVDAENRAIRRYFDDQERVRVDAIIDEYQQVHREARLLAGIEVPRDMSRSEYVQRLAAHNRAASVYAGREFPADAAPDRDVLPLPPHRTAGSISPRPTPDPHGADSFTAAIDTVMAQLEHDAVAGAGVIRSRELAAYVDEHAGSE